MVLLRDDLMCKRCGRDALGRPSTSDTGFGGGVGADISGTGVNSTAESSDTFGSLGAGGASAPSALREYARHGIDRTADPRTAPRSPHIPRCSMVGRGKRRKKTPPHVFLTLYMA